MSKILVVDDKEIKTMREACDYLNETYAGEYYFWLEENSDKEQVIYYRFDYKITGRNDTDPDIIYDLEDVLSHIGISSGFIKEVEDELGKGNLDN